MPLLLEKRNLRKIYRSKPKNLANCGVFGYYLNMEYKSTNLEETKQLALQFVDKLLKSGGKRENALVVALRGDLGSGKTTFVKAVAEIFGIQETITSPTFVLEKIYRIPESVGGFTHFVHIDAYRLQNGAEMQTLGWKELLESPQNIIFIEWPERVSGEIPEAAEKIRFRFFDETTRNINF